MTYIASTAEKVFKALTDGELTKRYWGGVNASDWKPGSTWKHLRGDHYDTVQMVGKVVTVIPPRQLVLTWAAPADEHTAGKQSRVSFEIETVADVVRLTVTHDDLDPVMAKGISGGWPRVLSSLKSLLETGKELDVSCHSAKKPA